MSTETEKLIKLVQDAEYDTRGAIQHAKFMLEDHQRSVDNYTKQLERLLEDQNDYIKTLKGFQAEPYPEPENTTISVTSKPAGQLYN